ncbi:hypothetical protein E4U02_09080 [Microbacterium paludicola]|uniref:Uncharacterized protein n=1 Tax=Microbacterium paludicola TaxID=300019 RepID=A0A4Y9FWX6_9MICO|nr:hypothetical protein [Microbacterium paludicola]MBF0816562.1 hypothetical protein [Microbacterium paludicola]TFU32755.1 hypothetical protein E4U02_09080 [Microbacterium paludicola]
MFGRRAEPPLPTQPWAGAGTTAEAVTVELPVLFGRKPVGCVRFAEGETFRADDLREAAAGRALVLESVGRDPLAFLFRADAPSPGSAIAPLAAGRDPESWLLAHTTGYDGAAALSTVLSPTEFAALGAWLGTR